MKLVFGHTANWRKKPTPDGFTHDWTVLVRGEENTEIKHFVEKVVFHLHDSFPKSKRGMCIFSHLYCVAGSIGTICTTSGI